MSTSIPDSASDRPAAGGSAERNQTSEPQVLLDARLDAIDQALLGLLPRSERLELVATIEARVHERLASGDEDVIEKLRAPAAGSIASGLAMTSVPTRRKKRSQVAIAAGLTGLAALALLFLLPVIYIVFTLAADLFNEEIIVGTIGSMHLLVFLAGSIAVMCGIVGLVKLSRHSERLRGYGWAITGLCCGPLPMFVGGLPLLLIGLPMVLSATFVTQTASPPMTVTASAGPYPSPVAGCSSGTCMPSLTAAAPYVTPAVPAGLPLPAAPAYYPADTAPIPPAPPAPPLSPATAPPLPSKPAPVGPSSPAAPPTSEEAADETPAEDTVKAETATTADAQTKAEAPPKPSADASSKKEVESD